MFHHWVTCSVLYTYTLPIQSNVIHRFQHIIFVFSQYNLTDTFKLHDIIPLNHHLGAKSHSTVPLILYGKSPIYTNNYLSPVHINLMNFIGYLMVFVQLPHRTPHSFPSIIILYFVWLLTWLLQLTMLTLLLQFINLTVGPKVFLHHSHFPIKHNQAVFGLWTSLVV